MAPMIFSLFSFLSAPYVGRNCFNPSPLLSSLPLLSASFDFAQIKTQDNAKRDQDKLTLPRRRDKAEGSISIHVSMS